jgi:hypothetical protein
MSLGNSSLIWQDMDAPSDPTTSPQRVRILLCHRDVDLALHCVQTAVHMSADPVQLVIHDDGSLTAQDLEILATRFPGSRVIQRQWADDVMASILSRYPNAWAFRQGSVWGLKLLDVVLAEPGLCFYMDSDICFFRPFVGLFVEAATRGRCVFLRDTVWDSYSIRPWHLAGHRALRVAAGINSGLTFCDSAVFDLDFVDWFLGQEDWRVIRAWIEPTCWAALALRANGHAVDPLQLTNLYPTARVSTHTLGGHFLSSYRSQWQTLLYSTTRDITAQPESVRFQPLRPLSAPALAINQLKRKLQNTILRDFWKP